MNFNSITITITIFGYLLILQTPTFIELHTKHKTIIKENSNIIELINNKQKKIKKNKIVKQGYHQKRQVIAAGAIQKYVGLIRHPNIGIVGRAIFGLDTLSDIHIHTDLRRFIMQHTDCLENIVDMFQERYQECKQLVLLERTPQRGQHMKSILQAFTQLSGFLSTLANTYDSTQHDQDIVYVRLTIHLLLQLEGIDINGITRCVARLLAKLTHPGLAQNPALLDPADGTLIFVKVMVEFGILKQFTRHLRVTSGSSLKTSMQCYSVYCNISQSHRQYKQPIIDTNVLNFIPKAISTALQSGPQLNQRDAIYHLLFAIVLLIDGIVTNCGCDASFVQRILNTSIPEMLIRVLRHPEVSWDIKAQIARIFRDAMEIIPDIPIPTFSWTIERIIWIGHKKAGGDDSNNNQQNDNSTSISGIANANANANANNTTIANRRPDCLFDASYIHVDIIRHILSFFDIRYDREWYRRSIEYNHDWRLSEICQFVARGLISVLCDILLDINNGPCKFSIIDPLMIVKRLMDCQTILIAQGKMHNTQFRNMIVNSGGVQRVMFCS